MEKYSRNLLTWFVVACVLWLVACNKDGKVIEDDDSDMQSDNSSVVVEESPLYKNNATLVIGQFVNRTRTQTIDYKRAGQSIYRITVEPPVAVAVAEGVANWGYFQFPKISKGDGDRIDVAWQMKPDDANSYGDHGFEGAFSIDMGKTWTRRSTPPPVVEYVDLPNGDKLSISTPVPFLVADYDIHPIPGTNRYLLDGLPEPLRSIYFNRKISGSNVWENEMAGLVDPNALRYTISNSTYFPVLWWGDMQVQSDQSILAGVYPADYRETNGSIPKPGVSFYRSTNYGRKWEYHSRIRNVPIMVGGQSTTYNYSEPALVRRSDNDHFCAVRTDASASPFNPLIGFVSKDKGLNWSNPVTIGPNGVLPRLLQLGNGITVLSSGRPGVQVRFSEDTDAVNWTNPLEMLPFSQGDNVFTATCGYTGLLPLDDNRFMIVYADFRHTTSSQTRKAIMSRIITIEKTQQ